MIDDILKSTKEQLLERISSPIIGSFVIAWSLWNYKFFVILFSAASVTKTFDLINSIVFPTTGDLILRGAVLPALTAAAYIFLYPYPALFVFKYTKERQREQNAIRQQIENETLLTEEESRAVHAKVREVVSAHREEVDQLNKEIERLTADLKAANTPTPPQPNVKGELSRASAIRRAEEMKQIAKKAAEERELHDKTKALNSVSGVTPSQFHLMKLLEKNGGQMEHKAILKVSGLTKVKTEFDLEELVDKELFNKDFSQDMHDYAYTFKQEGRRILLKENERIAREELEKIKGTKDVLAAQIASAAIAAKDPLPPDGRG
jgi:hypothetical protein